MNQEFIDYLKSIGMVDVLQQRVSAIYDFYEKVCPEKILSIFVSEYIKKDGAREYENLTFFSEKSVMEAKQFLTGDNFDFAPMGKRVFYWRIKKQDYDFQKATEKSRLNLRVNLSPTVMGYLLFKASKENCDHLKEVFIKHLLPNINV